MISGWLLDAYPIRDKMVLWIKQNNKTIRISDNWAQGRCFWRSLINPWALSRKPYYFLISTFNYYFGISNLSAFVVSLTFLALQLQHTVTCYC
jgi:hypothetical protein